jgi:hypothetical protein
MVSLQALWNHTYSYYTFAVLYLLALSMVGCLGAEFAVVSV